MPQNDEPNQLHKLFEKGRLYKIAKGNIVQSSDYRHVINLVKTGFIKRYMIANDGTIGVQSIYGADDVFPLTLIFQTLFEQAIYEGPEVYHYQAMSDAELYAIDKTTLLTAVQEQPVLYKDILQEAGKRFHSNIQHLENIALKGAYNRVAHELVYLGRRYGATGEQGVQIDLPFSHQDLADILSLTRETVSTSIKELRSNGLIKNGQGRSIIIPSLAKLEETAYN